MYISLNSESKSSPEIFQFCEGKIPPFIVPVTEYGYKSKENSCFLIEFCGIPSASTCGIKKFANNEGIFGSGLIAVLMEKFQNFFGYEFHMLVWLGHMKISWIFLRKSWKYLRNFEDYFPLLANFLLTGGTVLGTPSFFSSFRLALFTL